MTPSPKPSAFRQVLEWFGFGESAGSAHGHDHHAGGHGSHGGEHEAGGHGHTHGTIDPSITTSARGIWAVKWSFVILAITSALQILVVIVSGSVALLADTIHNVGDAATAIPLWIAFALARRKPSPQFPYGLGRAEDLAGLCVVLIIFSSAVVAGYSAIMRFIHPQAMELTTLVGAAGILGFLGNEAVAVFRIRVGREIQSAALIADGYHARTDGLTSLAVVLGAVGTAFGFPLADPIIGLLITIAIFGIVWQSSRAVFTRMLDGVEPDILQEIRHAVDHVPGILRIAEIKARWSGHRLMAELDVEARSELTLPEVDTLVHHVEEEIREHLPVIGSVRVRVMASRIAAGSDTHKPAPHSHAPAEVRFVGAFASGSLVIIDTPEGERMLLTLDEAHPNLEATVAIFRPEGEEILTFLFQHDLRRLSEQTPAEPHEFRAELRLQSGDRTEAQRFEMHEPHDHVH